MSHSGLVLLACLFVTVAFALGKAGGRWHSAPFHSASNSNETSSEELNATGKNGSAGSRTTTEGKNATLRHNSTRLYVKRNSISNVTTKTWESVMPTSCVDGWIAYNQSCYYVGQTPKTWATAQMDCNAFGASLWVVENLKEWQTVINYAIKSAFNWIGLSWPVGSSNTSWASQTCPGNSTMPIPMSAELLPWLMPAGSHGYTANLACVALYAYPDSGVSPYLSYRSCSTLSNYVCKGPNANVTGNSLVPNPFRNDTIV